MYILITIEYIESISSNWVWLAALRDMLLAWLIGKGLILWFDHSPVPSGVLPNVFLLFISSKWGVKLVFSSEIFSSRFVCFLSRRMTPLEVSSILPLILLESWDYKRLMCQRLYKYVDIQMQANWSKIKTPKVPIQWFWCFGRLTLRTWWDMIWCKRRWQVQHQKTLNFNNTVWNSTVSNPYVNLTFCTDRCEPLKRIFNRALSAVLKSRLNWWLLG